MDYRNFEMDLTNFSFLGKGHNGIVYMLPDGNVVKICTKIRSCKKEYSILKYAQGNKYFPKVYYYSGNIIIREYVPGIDLRKHIKKHGLSKKMMLEIVLLLESFEKIGFKKIDIRCKDIYVQEDETLKIIDPKNFLTRKTSYPRHLSKGLYKLGILPEFLAELKITRPNKYKRWFPKIDTYIRTRVVNIK
ncbi:MAG TPA: protein kinase [Clostridiaceae bacterium]